MRKITLFCGYYELTSVYGTAERVLFYAYFHFRTIETNRIIIDNRELLRAYPRYCQRAQSKNGNSIYSLLPCLFLWIRK